MNSFTFILSIINCLSISYLIFLFYKKNITKVNKPLLSTKSENIKIHLTRFNPFNEIGGNQSFILCLLDSVNSGVIITSLHNRDHTRIYAKEIKKGNVDPKIFSKEEKTILEKIIN